MITFTIISHAFEMHFFKHFTKAVVNVALTIVALRMDI